jgi:outer membrane biosynthesis protein TonB
MTTRRRNRPASRVVHIDDMVGTTSGWSLLVSVVAHAAMLVVFRFAVVHAWVGSTTESLPVGQLPVGHGVAGRELAGGDTFEIDAVSDQDPGDAPRGQPLEDDSDRAEGRDQERDRPQPPPHPNAEPAPEATQAPRVDPEPAPLPERAAPRGAGSTDPAQSASGAPRKGDVGPDAQPDGRRDGTGRRYGSADSPRGVRNLPRAFTRAIPAAVSADPAWGELALGRIGSVEVTISVDDDGKIAEVDIAQTTPPVLKRLVDRTMVLLRAGRFALAGVDGAGRQKLEIDVVLSHRNLAVDPDDQRLVLELGHEPPTDSAPGRAYFTLRSGRHVEARIRIAATRSM